MGTLCAAANESFLTPAKADYTHGGVFHLGRAAPLHFRAASSLILVVTVTQS